MRPAKFDELVLQWVESLQGISRDSRCRVLQNTYASLMKQSDKEKEVVAKKAQSLLEVVQSSLDNEKLRHVAVKMAQNSTADSIEELLAPCCSLKLRYGHHTIRRLTGAGNVATELATQNLLAKERWRNTGKPQVWSLLNSSSSSCNYNSSCGAISIGVRTGFMANDEDVALSFHDEVSFDICGRIDRVDRTLLVGCPCNEDDVRTTLQFGDSCTL